MTRTRLALSLALSLAPALVRGDLDPTSRGLTESEARACVAEIAAVEGRSRLVDADASDASPHVAVLAEAEAALARCVELQRRAGGRAEEELALRQEIAHRMPAHEDTPALRARIEREVRTEHALAKPSERRTAEEAALLESGAASGAVREREERWAGDPRVRRGALSGSRCHAARERDEARSELARAREADDGDRTSVYASQSRLRRAEDALSQREADLANVGGALPCSDPLVALLARCLAGDALPACEDPEVEAYLRIAQ